MAEQFPEDSRQVARSQNEDGTWNFSQVDISEVSFKGRFGTVAYSFSAFSISIGIKSFALVETAEFRVGDDVQVTSLEDTRVFMWGEVIATSTNAEGGTVVQLFVDDVSSVGSDATYTFWEIQIVARPKPGIEKDTSTTSVNPTTGGPWTFTVTAGKFFPIGGTLLIKPTADRTIALIGEVEAYSGTSLTVSLRATNATVSQAYTSWSIALLDAPPAKLPLYTIIGLQVTQNATDDFDIDIAAGSVMDSTGSVLLTLDSGVTKKLDALFAAGTNQGAIQRVQLTGTVSAAGTTVTGTGTNFRGEYFTEAGSGAGITEWSALGGTFLDTFQAEATFGTANITVGISTVASDTSLAASAAVAETNATYYRNGTAEIAALSTRTYYFVFLTRKDSDGSIDVCVSSITPSGEPDLPSGYTRYRLLTGIQFIRTGASAATMDIVQPLYENLFPFALDEEPFLVASATTTKKLPNSRAAQSSTSVTFQDNTTTFEFRRAALTGDVTASANSNATTIASNAVTNTKLNDMAAYTLKGRNAGTTGDPSDIDITALTEQASPTTTDYLIGVDTAASNAFKKYKASNFGGGTTFPSDMGLITEASTTTFDCGTIV